jgi:hypothetical protein
MPVIFLKEVGRTRHIQIRFICRVGQNCIYTYMTVYLVISLPKYGKYTVYVWFWPNLFIYYRTAGTVIMT